MDFSSSKGLIFVLLIFALCVLHINAETQTCTNRRSPCFLKKIPCPSECPLKSPSDPKAKVCYLDCDSPICKTQCKSKTIILYFSDMTSESI